MAFVDVFKKRQLPPGVIRDDSGALTPDSSVPTASPAMPPASQPRTPPNNAAEFYGDLWGTSSPFQFTSDNIGQYHYGVDLNPLSQQTGVSRDQLATMRDAFVQPKTAEFRRLASGQGGAADANDAALLQDAGFQQWLKSGIMPAISAAQSGQGGAGGAGRTTFDFQNFPGFQFDDPYTKQLEDMVRQNLSAIQQPQANPGLDKFLSYLDSQFSDLSAAPGYSPEDLALIRTQMLEPIERDRQAARARVEQRTAARGMLPSSGLHEQDLQDLVDRPAEEKRIAAQRDIALNAINQRQRDQGRALDLGRLLGIEIPGLQRSEDQSRRAEAMNLSSLLYDLPNRAQQQAMNAIQGSPGPQDLFSQAIQLQQQQELQRQNTFNRGAQLGQMIIDVWNDDD